MKFEIAEGQVCSIARLSVKDRSVVRNAQSSRPESRFSKKVIHILKLVRRRIAYLQKDLLLEPQDNLTSRLFFLLVVAEG